MNLRIFGPFSTLRILLFALVFGGIGILIWHSFAAPNPNLSGDLNNDNKVDSADLAIMVVNFNTSFSGADINGDGVVNGADFNQLLTHYGQTYTPPSGSKLNTVAKVLYDMEPPNEGSAHGEATVNIPPKLSYNMPPPGTGYVEAWGTIYADLSNTYPANVRVEVKHLETYIWSISQAKWVRVQAVTAPGGALYSYGFTSHIAGNKRTEPDGGVSMVMQDNYLYHFFPTSHAAITESDVGGVFTTVQARLILDSPTGPNNLAQAKFLVQSGGDFYPTSGTYSFNNSPNVGLGGSKHVYLTPTWQAVSYYTGGPSSVINDSRTKYPAQAWTESRLQTNPPPLDGMGLP